MSEKSVPRGRVLITDYTWPDLNVEKSVLGPAGIDLVVADSGEPGELTELAKDADAILTCFRRVPAQTLRAATRLRAVVRYGVGVDNIDVAEATRLGIPVSNVPDYCAEEVADHTLMFLLALNRRLRPLSEVMVSGGWSMAGPAPWRLRGRVLGLIGYGPIGRAFAHRAHALGMRILVATLRSIPRELPLNAAVADVDTVIRESDVLSLHVPLTDSTRHLIDADALSRMKPGAVLINTARGGLVHTPALLAALESGQLSGAALDVSDPEPIPADHPLRFRGDVLLTPHTAFYSEGSVAELARRASEQVVAAIDGIHSETVVNPEVFASGRSRW